MTAPTAEVYADTEDNCVSVVFPAYTHDTLGPIAAHAVSMDAENARLFARALTIASYTLEGDTFDEQP